MVTRFILPRNNCRENILRHFGHEGKVNFFGVPYMGDPLIFIRDGKLPYLMAWRKGLFQFFFNLLINFSTPRSISQKTIEKRDPTKLIAGKT